MKKLNACLNLLGSQYVKGNKEIFRILLYVAGKTGSVLIREVSALIRRSLIEGFHCTIIRTLHTMGIMIRD